MDGPFAEGARYVSATTARQTVSRLLKVVMPFDGFASLSVLLPEIEESRGRCGLTFRDFARDWERWADDPTRERTYAARVDR
jgi:hypothetical protein